MDESKKKIKKIGIYGLFGMFNHEFNLHVEENITILHGQNGVGKTTVLRIIDDLFSNRIRNLYDYVFDRIRIEFTDHSYIEVKRKDFRSDGLAQLGRSLDFSGSTINKTLSVVEDEYQLDHNFTLSVIEDLIPSLERINKHIWVDRRTGERLNSDDVYDRYGRELSYINNRYNITKNNKKKYISSLELVNEMLENTLKTHLIQTQRLIIDNSKKHIITSNTSKSNMTIENYAEEMADMIKDAIRNSGIKSASLDRTFPNRILSGPLPDGIDDLFIKEKFTDQNNYRERLMSAGLIEEEGGENLIPDSKLDDLALKVLWHYLNDVDSKFEAYREILPKVELFQTIINDRFRFKKMLLSKKHGFTFKSDTGQPIPLKSLSSGEQHELVLTYELIFKVPEKTLILIDEPELSLHVTWQQKFISDIKKISEISKLDFIIATHSPSIVHEHRKLMEEIPSELIEVYNV